jgi:hypothetical protein
MTGVSLQSKLFALLSWPEEPIFGSRRALGKRSSFSPHVCSTPRLSWAHRACLFTPGISGRTHRRFTSGHFCRVTNTLTAPEIASRGVKTFV